MIVRVGCPACGSNVYLEGSYAGMAAAGHLRKLHAGDAFPIVCSSPTCGIRQEVIFTGGDVICEQPDGLMLVCVAGAWRLDTPDPAPRGMPS